MSLYNEYDDNVPFSYSPTPAPSTWPMYMRRLRHRKRINMIAPLVVLAFQAKKQKIAARRSRRRYLRRAEHQDWYKTQEMHRG